MNTRQTELEAEAKTGNLTPQQTRVYVALFMKRFPDEPVGSYRAEWLNRVRSDTFGIGWADDKTRAVIDNALMENTDNEEGTFILLSWSDMTDMGVVLDIDDDNPQTVDEVIERKTFKTRKEAEAWAKANLNFNWQVVKLEDEQ